MLILLLEAIASLQAISKKQPIIEAHIALLQQQVQNEIAATQSKLLREQDQVLAALKARRAEVTEANAAQPLLDQAQQLMPAIALHLRDARGLYERLQPLLDEAIEQVATHLTSLKSQGVQDSLRQAFPPSYYEHIEHKRRVIQEALEMWSSKVPRGFTVLIQDVANFHCTVTVYADGQSRTFSRSWEDIGVDAKAVGYVIEVAIREWEKAYSS